MVINGNLDNIFQILEQKYAKTEMVGGFDTYESVKMTPLLVRSTHDSCNQSVYFFQLNHPLIYFDFGRITHFLNPFTKGMNIFFQ